MQKANMRLDIGSIFLIISCGLLLVVSPSLAVYDLPNNDADCPGNCRQIPWSAGSDQWNGGVLPNYTAVTCSGLAANGTTNDGPAIQTCINNAAVNTAVYVPAGTYYINSALTLKSNVALRGAGAPSPWLPDTASAATTFIMGPNSYVYAGGSRSNMFGSQRAISSGYTKGSQTLVMASGHGLAANDWISIFEDADAAIPVSISGDDGSCTWCGDVYPNGGTHLMQQFSQVTGVNGDTITISRPMYYTYKSSLNPGIKKVTWGGQASGVENIKFDGGGSGGASRGEAFVYFESCLYCWVKGVETYYSPDVSKASHVKIEYSHGDEVRDSYFHKGRGNGGDRNYGIALFFWNSDLKFENNILRENRHSIDFEGGGAGCAVLNNYIDDNYTDDPTYLGSARANHGSHPYMNLWEGNVISHVAADNYWGSSSHNVFFRNWLWGDETGNIPQLPDWGFYAIDVWLNQNYYSFVGNVFGKNGGHVNWSSALLATAKNSDCNADPVVYRYGCDSNGNWNSTARATSINHGNYDYRTNGVAFWEGGSDPTLKTSMYYRSKPSWFGNTPWPAIGPDVAGLGNIIPAQIRYGAIPGADATPPAAPTGMRVK